jgi:hypothetical protein
MEEVRGSNPLSSTQVRGRSSPLGRPASCMTWEATREAKSPRGADLGYGQPPTIEPSPNHLSETSYDNDADADRMNRILSRRSRLGSGAEGSSDGRREVHRHPHVKLPVSDLARSREWYERCSATPSHTVYRVKCPDRLLRGTRPAAAMHIVKSHGGPKRLPDLPMSALCRPADLRAPHVVQDVRHGRAVRLLRSCIR